MALFGNLRAERPHTVRFYCSLATISSIDQVKFDGDFTIGHGKRGVRQTLSFTFGELVFTKMLAGSTPHPKAAPARGH